MQFYLPSNTYKTCIATIWLVLIVFTNGGMARLSSRGWLLGWLYTEIYFPHQALNLHY